MIRHKKRDFKRKGEFSVYIVKCVSGTYYTGYTSDLETRIKLHNSGHGAKYLRGKGPVELVYAKEYKYYKNALNAERDLKKLTRIQKEELIKIYNKSPIAPCFLAKARMGLSMGFNSFL